MDPNEPATKAESKTVTSKESMFVKHPKQELKGKDDQFAGIFSRDVHFHSDEPNEYGNGEEQEQVGTIVPVSDREGGIKGKPNKYGKVIVGSRITEEEQTPLDVSTIEANEQVSVEAVDVNVSNGVPGTSSVPIPEHTTLSDSPVQILFEGTFGSFKGVYKAVFKQNGMVIAIYGSGNPVYTPPISENPFRIKTADIDCQVAHIGICFETELFNCGFQIFVIKG